MIVKSYKVFESLFSGRLRYLGENPTADTIVTRIVDGIQQVLLIKRSKWVLAEPDKWSIPGGFVDTTADEGRTWKEDKETIIQAAKREILEETGLDILSLDDSKFKLISINDSIERDPRNTKHSWIKSHTFLVEIPGSMGNNIRGMDDAQMAKWFTIEELSIMNSDIFAFDHMDRLMELGFINID
jgi:ADP-ribose pyrophosphatase YjhB (NUDIX family)